MKEKRVEKLPVCDFKNLSPVHGGCLSFAIYDAPTDQGTSWGYMCSNHYKAHKGPMADEIGFKLVEGIAEPVDKNTKAVHGIEPGLDDLEYWENALFSDREVECPECGCGKRVEPDAHYVYNCEGCGIRVKVPMPPI